MKKSWDKKLVIKELRNLRKRLNRTPVKRDSSLLYFMSRKFYGTWNNAMKIAGFKVKDFQKPTLPNIRNLNLCYFVGLLLADGHLVDNKKTKKYNVKLYTSSELRKKEILNLIKNLFHYNPTIRKRRYGFNKKTNYEIIISSKEVLKYLTENFNLPSGAKSKIIRVPERLKNEKYFFRFLRGFIDGDGWINKDYITLTSSSLIFLREIRNFLENSNVRCLNLTKSTETVWCLKIPVRNNSTKIANIYKI